ncbi:hypothetical protein GCM10008933_10980 [Paenibacillus motobuensis]|uniref:Integrase n=1 Tax=Paenibacillus motobuensis TaxID=295324 RepID=A0ABP3HVV7_9BACL
MKPQSKAMKPRSGITRSCDAGSSEYRIPVQARILDYGDSPRILVKHYASHMD